MLRTVSSGHLTASTEHTKREGRPAGASIAVRRFASGDMQRVVGFHREVYESNFPGFVWSERFALDFEQALLTALGTPTEGLFVVESPSQGVVGFVWVGMSLRSHSRDRVVGVIKDLYVVPEHRGQGLGRALQCEGEQFARSHLATRIILEVTASNTAAVALYESAGYHVERHLMEKPLARPG